MTIIYESQWQQLFTHAFSVEQSIIIWCASNVCLIHKSKKVCCVVWVGVEHTRRARNLELCALPFFFCFSLHLFLAYTKKFSLLKIACILYLSNVKEKRRDRERERDQTEKRVAWHLCYYCCCYVVFVSLIEWVCKDGSSFRVPDSRP